MKTIKNKKPTTARHPLVIETPAGSFMLEVRHPRHVRLSRPGTVLFLEQGRQSKGWHLQQCQRRTSPTKTISPEQIIAAFAAWQDAHPRIFSMLVKLAERAG